MPRIRLITLSALALLLPAADARAACPGGSSTLSPNCPYSQTTDFARADPEYPWSMADVAVRPNGEFFLLDQTRNRVQRYRADGTLERSFGSRGARHEDFDTPSGMAWDETRGRLYVADTLNNRIEAFTADGYHMMSIGGSQGSSVGQLSLPRDVAVDPDTGDLYVADSVNNRVSVFRSDGTFVRVLGDAAGLRFDNLRALTVAGGFVYTVEGGTASKVQRFSLTGSEQRSYLLAGNGHPGPTGPYPQIDVVNGKIIVTSSEGLRQTPVDQPSPQPWTTFGSATQSGPPAHADANTVLVATGDAVLKLSPTGAQLGSVRERAAADLEQPTAVVRDSAGNTYVADEARGRVVKYDITGALVANTAAGLLQRPRGLALTADGTEIFVADAIDGSREAVVKLATTNLVAEPAAEQPTLPLGEPYYKNPAGVAVDGNGRLWIADTGNARLVRFDIGTAGEASNARFFGGFGTSPGQFRRPVGLAADSNRIYVADQGNGRVQVADLGGDTGPDTASKFSPIGELGSTDGKFQDPSGVSVSGNRLYVTDTLNRRVQEFTTGGTFVARWGSPAAGVIDPCGGRFERPVGIFATGSSVYVADEDMRRVVDFKTPPGGEGAADCAPAPAPAISAPLEAAVTSTTPQITGTRSTTANVAGPVRVSVYRRIIPSASQPAQIERRVFPASAPQSFVDGDSWSLGKINPPLSTGSYVVEATQSDIYGRHGSARRTFTVGDGTTGNGPNSPNGTSNNNVAVKPPVGARSAVMAPDGSWTLTGSIAAGAAQTTHRWVPSGEGPAQEPQTLPASAGPQFTTWTIPAAALRPATTYTYRLTASNSAGEATTTPLTFTTPKLEPVGAFFQFDTTSPTSLQIGFPRLFPFAWDSSGPQGGNQTSLAVACELGADFVAPGDTKRVTRTLVATTGPCNSFSTGFALTPAGGFPVGRAYLPWVRFLTPYGSVEKKSTVRRYLGQRPELEDVEIRETSPTSATIGVASRAFVARTATCELRFRRSGRRGAEQRVLRKGSCRGARDFALTARKLKPLTGYAYRFVLTYPGGKVYSKERSFTTAPRASSASLRNGRVTMTGRATRARSAARLDVEVDVPGRGGKGEPRTRTVSIGSVSADRVGPGRVTLSARVDRGAVRRAGLAGRRVTARVSLSIAPPGGRPGVAERTLELRL